VDTLLQALRAAAEPTRLRLLAIGAAADLTVTELSEVLGQSQPRVSRHLKVLERAGLLERLREGAFAVYRLATRGPGGELAAELVGRLPPGDPVLSLDRARLDRVLERRAAAAEAYFRENAGDWDRIRSLHVDEAEVERAIQALVGEAPIEDLLDVGTGTGRILALLSPSVRRAIGIDRSSEMLAVARANLVAEGVRHCQVRLGDMYALPWARPSFDLAIVHQVLHFAEAPERALAEVARVLRPGGRVLVVDFAPHGVDALRGDRAHRWLGFEDAQVAAWLAEAGLRLETVRHLAGRPLTVTLWLGRRPDVEHPDPNPMEEGPVEAPHTTA
jgi:ubiquinone/menaquinone biosynthesis C-methylase UbiE